MYSKTSLVTDDALSLIRSELPWESLHSKKILLTGAGGLISSNLARVFAMASTKYNLELGLVAVGRKRYEDYPRLHFLNKVRGFEYRQVDLCDTEIPELPPCNIIIHGASQASPKYYKADPIGTMLPNSIGTLNLLKYGEKLPSCDFLYLSSGAVYGFPGEPLVIEEENYGILDPLSERACYSESKRFGETLCLAYHRQIGLNTKIARIFHTYGPSLSLDDGRVFSDFIADAVRGDNIRIYGDGSEVRSFCYVSDAVRALLYILFFGESGHAYNVGNPSQSLSIYDLAKIIQCLYPDRVQRIEFATRSNDSLYTKGAVPSNIPSVEKLKRLGWRPCVNIGEGFKRCIEFHLQ